MISQAHTAVISTRTGTERQRKRKNCNRHSQELERSQLSYRGRNRANQLVLVEVSVDFTMHTLLSSAHEHEQRDSANDKIVIVTDKAVSAVNCPIEEGIVPFNWLLWRYLLISRAHTAVISTRTRTERQHK